MRWKLERAVLRQGWRTWLIIDDQDFRPHPEAMGFVIALEAADRSSNTVKTYLMAIASFLTWADGDGVDWRVVNVLDLTRYKRYLQQTTSRTGRSRSPATVRIALTALTEFIRYCAAEGHVDPVIANRLVENRWVQPKPRRGKGEGGQFRRTRINALRVNVADHPPQTLSDDQVDAMRDFAASARDRFLLRILHEGGPRIGEALGMRTEDVHLLPNSRSLGCVVEGPHFHVNRRTDNQNEVLAKSRRTRYVPVSSAFISDFRDYQHERFIRLGDRHSAYLFVNYEGPGRGNPMTYSNTYKIIARLGTRCGFRATPHMFRHSAATAWIEAGSDVDVVQELLGHSSSMSTGIYVHASDARLRQAVATVHSVREPKL